jgi:peptidyl-prolyl cis-trans isomerase A (cyclophilin A)
MLSLLLLWMLACQEGSVKKTENTEHQEKQIHSQVEMRSPESSGKEIPEKKLSTDVSKKILLNPSDKIFQEKAPEIFKVRFETTQGDFVVEVHRSWAPGGADRFYNLLRLGFYNEVRFFRVVENFMAQFGISGDPDLSRVWGNRGMSDAPVKKSNLRGMISYAKTTFPNSRSTQLFINYKDNSFLDRRGFAPFAKVIKGMNVVDKLYSGYGNGPPTGPHQGLIQQQGNAYLKKTFPKLDWVKKTVIVK